jgi:hypothetical protein
MTLQFQQFWHVAPISARSDIAQYGIDVRRGAPVWEEYGSNLGGRANFVWDNLRDARIYQRMANTASRDEESPNWNDFSGQTYDIHEVTIPSRAGIRAVQDPEFDNARAIRQPIPRRFVRFVEGGGPTDVG